MRASSGSRQSFCSIVCFVIKMSFFFPFWLPFIAVLCCKLGNKCLQVDEHLFFTNNSYHFFLFFISCCWCCWCCHSCCCRCCIWLLLLPQNITFWDVGFLFFMKFLRFAVFFSWTTLFVSSRFVDLATENVYMYAEVVTFEAV